MTRMLKNTIFIGVKGKKLKAGFIRNMIIWVAALAGLCVLFMAGKEIKRKWIVYATLHSRHWRERVAEIEAIKPGRYQTIFLGNSLTELFWLDQYFPDTTILNCGIVGDFTEGLLKRTGGIIRLKPKKLFIEIGINDLVEQIPLSEITGNYRTLIRRIKQESPATQIYIQSNLPVIIYRPGFLAGDATVNENVREQNRNLKMLASQENVTYIDLYGPFMRSGRLGELLVEDGIHLTPKAYTVWKLTVSPYLAQ